MRMQHGLNEHISVPGIAGISSVIPIKKLIGTENLFCEGLGLSSDGVADVEIEVEEQFPYLIFRQSEAKGSAHAGAL